MDDDRIELARKLFTAWSSGDNDAPAQFFAEDGILFDTVGGTHTGWAEIRKFFADGNLQWPDLGFDLKQFWTNDDGVAVTWVMSATVPDARLGPEAEGRRWEVPGMTELTIRDGKVVYEADHWHGGAVMRSLGLKG